MATLARPFAHLVAIATTTALVIGLVLWLRSGFATPPYVFMRGPLPMLAFLAAAGTQLASGWVLAIRRPDLPIGRLGLLFALVVGLAFLANAYLALESRGVALPLDGRWVAWLPNWVGFSAATLLAVTLGLVFPDGVLGPRWRLILAGSILGGLLTSVALAELPGPLILFPPLTNPMPAPESLTGVLRFAGAIGIAMMGIGAISVAAALGTRYRGAGREVRLQLRWYIATAVVLVIGFLAFLAALVTLPNGSPWGELILTLFILSGGLPPIALFVAITRYRLFDIDALLSRAFVYGALTAILAGLYTASIRLFNSLFTSITGESSDLTLVITTLVLATSFTPLKRRLEAFVERRFHVVEAGPAGTAAPGSAMPARDDVRRAIVELMSEPTFVETLRAALDDAHPAPEHERQPTSPAPSVASEPASPSML